MSLLTRELHKKSMLKKSELVDKVQDDKVFGFEKKLFCEFEFVLFYKKHVLSQDNWFFLLWNFRLVIGVLMVVVVGNGRQKNRNN